MEQKSKAILLQVIGAVLILIAILGSDAFNENQIIFILFLSVGVMAIGLFLLGFILERKSKQG
ncbi:MAG: hypothetical protein ACTSRS_04180 [Candidatus Helarchaeota archaeon]